MFKHRFASALMLLFVLFASTAQAFWDPPHIVPANPLVGETVSVVIRGGVCDTLIGTSGFPQLTRSGNAIRILFSGAHTTDLDFCNYPVGAGIFPLASYTAGSYTLQVDLLYDNYPLGPGVMTLGIVPFTVTATTTVAVPVPIDNSIALLALTLLVAGFGVCMLRHRKQALS